MIRLSARRSTANLEHRLRALGAVRGLMRPPGCFALAIFAIFCMAGVATSIASYTTAGLRRPSSPPEQAKGDRGRAAVRLADATDNWLQSLLDPGFWRKGKSDLGRSHQPRADIRPRARIDSDRESRPQRSERSWRIEHQRVRAYDVVTYRTMCVRLCDGYHWPISFTATKREFARDSDICQRSCDSPVALHVYRNPGEEPEQMVDLKGQPYTQLDTAFRYRVSYDAACKCRPHPWEHASRERHLGYAQSQQVHATTTATRK